jgi:superfamily II DNA or RNA helicase
MSTLTPTAEQQAAVDAFTTGGTVVVHAGAGTGKTSTLRLLSAARSTAKGLYLAYNKAIQTEAERSFPRNVDCRTAHSLRPPATGQW